MQQHLYLVRHAHALDDAPTDALRPLSVKGRKQCVRLAKGLRTRPLEPLDAIWQSGLTRAYETAETLREHLSLTQLPLTQKDGLSPFDNPAAIAAQLNQLTGNTLLVGHEPNLSHLSSLLLAGHSDFQRLVFAKASILCLSRLTVATQSTPWQIEYHLSHHFFK